MWTIAEFNVLDADRAGTALLACCAAPQWAADVEHARPFTDRAALLAAGDRAFESLGGQQIDAALAAHPSIGVRSGGGDAAAAWSRGEQAAALAAGLPVRAALAEADAAYRRRFGRVFLVCATGRGAEDLLAEARRRLGNDPESEAVEVARELHAIVRLRLAKLVAP